MALQYSERYADTRSTGQAATRRPVGEARLISHEEGTRLMGRTFWQATLAAVALAMILPLAACSSEPTASTVEVTLGEWSIGVDADSVPAGEVTFNATNNGPDDAHEMVLVKTDLAPADLPVDETGKVDEEGEGITFIGEIEEIPVGESDSATYDLAAGNYVLFCNIVDTAHDPTEVHYGLGRRLAFTVE